MNCMRSQHSTPHMDNNEERSPTKIKECDPIRFPLPRRTYGFRNRRTPLPHTISKVSAEPRTEGSKHTVNPMIPPTRVTGNASSTTVSVTLPNDHQPIKVKVLEESGDGVRLFGLLTPGK